MFTYYISDTIDPKEWNHELRKSSYASFFQSFEYLYSQASGSNNYLKFIIVKDNEGKIKGQLGIVVTQRYEAYSSHLMSKSLKLFSNLGRRASWAGGPVLHETNENNRIEILKKIITALKEMGIKENLSIIDGYSPHLDFEVNQQYLNEFKREKFNVNNFLTYVTDLSNDLNDIWKGIHDSTKRDINKAKKRDLVVKELTSLDELEQYFNLGKVWAKTKGIDLQISSQYKEAYWKCLKSQVEKVFLAFENNELISSHRLGCFNKIAFNHKMTNSYNRPTSVGGPLLTWSSIEWAKQNGMKYYDYSGGESPPLAKNDKKRYAEQWESLLTYKRKWGGKEYPYYHMIKVRKKGSYKIFRLLSKPDWLIRNYKNKRFKRPKNEYKLK